MAKKLTAILLLVAALGACKASKEAYDEAFRKSWRESFIKSCVGDDKTEPQQTMCACVADQAIKDLTVAQLTDPNYSIKYIKETIIPACTPKP